MSRQKHISLSLTNWVSNSPKELTLYFDKDPTYLSRRDLVTKTFDSSMPITSFGKMEIKIKSKNGNIAMHDYMLIHINEHLHNRNPTLIYYQNTKEGKKEYISLEFLDDYYECNTELEFPFEQYSVQVIEIELTPEEWKKQWIKMQFDEIDSQKLKTFKNAVGEKRFEEMLEEDMKKFKNLELTYEENILQKKGEIDNVQFRTIEPSFESYIIASIEKKKKAFREWLDWFLKWN